MHHSLRLEIPTDFSEECKQILTPRTPHHTEEITIRVQILQQLLMEFKKNTVNEEQLLDKLRNASHFMKRRRSLCDNYRYNDIPKQIESLNKIKQNNQRILKGRIKYLEQKLKKLDFVKVLRDQNGIKQLQQKLQENAKVIKKAENQSTNLKTSVNSLQQQNNRLRKQIYQLNQHISRIPRISLKVSSHSQTVPQRLCETWAQTQNTNHWHITSWTQTNNKLLRLHKLDQIRFQPIRQWDEQIQNLYMKLELLQTTNSSLRKQMVKIHNFMEQQDQKYRQNLQKLQEKIKKLTHYDQIKKSKVKMIESACFRWDSPTRRSSDFGLEKYPGSFRQKMASSQIVQIADLKIKLQLSKNNSPKKVSEQDSKITLASALSENH